ncbi:TonB-dependent receptor [Paraflavitalea sp. CAU 1676]|uniref:SusC/RagA family TonB-linked outer membrane protein n=1 Tax=Paraflavitalea sp. CAU 1676 TaxID=3032598 RepID=UPI0023DC4BB3|nr:TonB-dependent receptor [Paraflavitalea sp. CAU 1676]MDF2191516.1 TonB-dependent receptor [Paraflavitalea sp. CAU 1676]
MRKRMIALSAAIILAVLTTPGFAADTGYSPWFQQTDKTVSGKVSDEKGAPLAGATVAVKGSKVSTLTKEDGTFTLKVPTGSTMLTVSFVGMLDQEVNVAEKTMISVTLNGMGGNMNDVVVVGYGTQKRSQTTGAVATIKAQDIQDIPAPNIAGTLRGRVAGLGVSSVSGRPGAGITLNVRNAFVSDQADDVGATNQPLYVIDNIIVTKSDFDALDPSMVEDITILKDATAAIYGAAGAKGVILITTKRGKPGAPKLNYNGYVGHTDATRKPEMLSGYDLATLLNDTYRINNVAPSNFFTQKDLDYIQRNEQKSWFDEIWRPALTQRHNLSLSGGSDKMTFFVGGSYQNENANYASMKADKFSFRSGLTAKIANNVKADINFNVDHNIKTSKNGLSENDQQFLEKIIQIPRWVPYSINGKWVNFNSNLGMHPQGQMESGYYENTKTKGYRINTSLSYAPESGPLKGLTARLQFSQAGNGTDRDDYRPNYKIYNFIRGGNNGALYTDTLTPTGAEINVVQGTNQFLRRKLGNANSYQATFTLQYQRTFGQHSINVIAGGEQSESNAENLAVEWLGQEIPNVDEFWAFGQSPVVRDKDISESSKRSFFSRLSYNFAGKYSLEGITRYDASANFATGNIWGVFPSVGLGWLVSEERFFRDVLPSVNYFKLRANFGLTGDDRIDQRLWQEWYAINITGYMYNETLVPGLKQNRIPNPDITWEKKRTLNIGADVSLFNNKLSLGVDVFQNFSYDAFDKGATDNFPMYAGFTPPLVNYMERYSWGSEFSIGYQTRFTPDLSFKSSINFSFGNAVTSRTYYNPYLLWDRQAEDWQIHFGTDPRKYNSNNIGMITEGMFRSQEDVDAFLAKKPNYTINGLVPQAGWLYFKDINGDGVITDKDKTTMFDHIDPTLATGIQLSLTYKSLAMNVNIAARFGGKEFYDSKARRSRPTPNNNVPSFWTDRWTPENHNGKFPRHDDASIVAGWESDFWAVDGTMIRVNDMTIVYSVPEKIIKKAGFSNARILATGNNLWVLKNPLKYKDPYSSYIFDYPTLRTISVGLSLGL